MKKKFLVAFAVLFAISFLSNQAKAIQVTTRYGKVVNVVQGNCDTSDFLDWVFNDLDEIVCGD